MGRKKRDAISDLDRNLDKTNESLQSENAENKEGLEVDLGLDISTSAIGITLLDYKTGNLVKFDHIKLNIAKLNTLFEKADYADNWLSDNIKNVTVKRIFVEASAKGFTVGFSSADTLFTLAKFNALVSYLSHKRFAAPVFDINVSSARAKLGVKIDRKDKKSSTKEKVRKEVLLLYPNLPIKMHIAKTGKSKGMLIPDKEMEDAIDSFVICKGGRITCLEPNK